MGRMGSHMAAVADARGASESSHVDPKGGWHALHIKKVLSFVQSRHNLVITGPTGIGKSYLACAFVERARRRGHTAYVHLPRLLQQLAVARGDGSYARILDRLQRFELPAIDD